MANLPPTLVHVGDPVGCHVVALCVFGKPALWQAATAHVEGSWYWASHRPRAWHFGGRAEAHRDMLPLPEYLSEINDGRFSVHAINSAVRERGAE